MDLKLTIEQKQRVILAPKTNSGGSAEVDGTPTWELTEGTATVEPEADGKAAWIISSDTPGDVSKFKVTADADRGEGVRNIVAELVLTTTEAEANDLGITLEPPVLK